MSPRMLASRSRGYHLYKPRRFCPEFRSLPNQHVMEDEQTNQNRLIPNTVKNAVSMQCSYRTYLFSSPVTYIHMHKNQLGIVLLLRHDNSVNRLLARKRLTQHKPLQTQARGTDSETQTQSSPQCDSHEGHPTTNQ